jgi:hypothetical protein
MFIEVPDSIFYKRATFHNQSLFSPDFNLTFLLNSIGYLVVMVPGDGACLLNAVSMAICGDLSLVEPLRRRLVDFYISTTSKQMFFTCILS